MSNSEDIRRDERIRRKARPMSDDKAGRLHKDCRAAYTRLDVTWSRVHEAAMGPIRKAMGNPNAPVPEICAALESIKQEREALAEVEAAARALIVQAQYDEWRLRGLDDDGNPSTPYNQERLAEALAKLDEVRKHAR